MAARATIMAMMWACPSTKVAVSIETHITNAKEVFIKKFGVDPAVLFVRAAEVLQDADRITCQGMRVSVFRGMTPNHVVLARTAEDFLGNK